MPSVASQVVPHSLILGSPSLPLPTAQEDRWAALKKRHSLRGVEGESIATGLSLLRRSWTGKLPAGTAQQQNDMPVYRLYPHTTNGRRELKAQVDDRPLPDGYNRSVSAASTRNERPTSRLPVDPIELPTSSSDEANEPMIEDFQDRHAATSSYASTNGNRNAGPLAGRSHPPQQQIDSPDFSDFDDGASVASVANSRRAQTSTPKPTSMDAQQRNPSVPAPQARKKSSASVVSERGYGGPGDRSSTANSTYSEDTIATSVHPLPPLQTKGPDNSDAQLLEPVLEDDPRSFDLVAPPQEEQNVGMYAMEKRAEQMFSQEHLKVIFDDPKLLLKFTGYLNSHRPQSIPILIYYLDALKALRAIKYANAIAEGLDSIRGFDFTEHSAKPTVNSMLEEKATRAFEVLVREDLPAYVAYTWTQVVSVSIQRRITGTLAPHLREASEGLAEVFCLTDPSRADNPIVFASEEFSRTTQYGMGYTIGRNCRFLQGPRTNPNSIRRMAQACKAGKEHTEVFVNYRRDGSPFMNLLMIAPLMDSRGNIRYFIGAQADVSALIKDCSELDGLAKLVDRERHPEEEESSTKDEFQALSEMLNGTELDMVRRCGGRMHKEYDDDADSITSHSRARLVLKDPTQDALDNQRSSISSSVDAGLTQPKMNGKLEGVYQHYLLIRPAPSLRILFSSPSLRVPGILQSPFLNRIGGSSRVRTDLAAALSEGRGVTAKIRWLAKPDENGEGEGRPRWIHCTPLLGHSGAVGVWMIVLVDDPDQRDHMQRRFREAPPVASNIMEARDSRSRERRQLNAYDKESERRGGGAARAERDFLPSTTSNIVNQVGGYSRSERSRPPNARRRSGVDSGNVSEFEFEIQTPVPGRASGAGTGW